MLGYLKEGVSLLLELVLPRQCAACDHAGDDAAASDGPFCHSCAGEILKLVAQPSCPRCGSRLGEGLSAREDGCRGCPTPMPRFDRVVRLGPYEGPLRAAVKAFKFHGHHGIGQWSTCMLAQAIRAVPELQGVELVQAIPLHWLRRLRRGYNQAALLADALAAELDLPLADSLVRVRNTPPQVGLPRTRRLENIKGAFAARRTREIAGRHVLLVDDVTTTGATASEAARTLLAAGAARVSLAVLAKAEAAAPFTPAPAEG